MQSCWSRTVAAIMFSKALLILINEHPVGGQGAVVMLLTLVFSSIS